MNKFLGIIVLIAIAIIVIVFVAKPKDTTMPTAPAIEDGEVAELVDGQYAVVSESSIVTWSGSNGLDGLLMNKGVVQIADASMSVIDGMLSEGFITFDMTSIEATELFHGENYEQLAGHLQAEDFFDTANFPAASFILVNATHNGEGSVTLEGNLVIKETTLPHTIEAKLVQTEDGSLRLVGETIFDRTTFGVSFEGVGEAVVANNATLAFDLIFTAQ